MRPSHLALATSLLFHLGGHLPAQQPPSYARQVRPFLARYCLECHNTERLKGGLNLESFKGLQAGGEKGSIFVAGKPNDSRVVLMVEGKAKPHMPPRKARQPHPDEVGVLRAWIAAGAKDDTTTLAVKVPDVKPRGPTAAAVAALAYRPDGKLLAAGGYKDVTLIDVDSHEVTGKLPGQAGEVTALAFSQDGHWLAVASGLPARSGEVRLYAVPADGLPGGRPAHVLAGHKDLLLGVAFRPDGKVLATCGYDRLIKLWDTATGKELRTLKDHSDSVYGVAFSPDGSLLVSGAADRAVKVWDVATGTRLYTLSEPTDWVYAVAWSPDGEHVAAAGVDKAIRVWQVTRAGGRVVHSVFAHEGPVTRLAYSPDGKVLYSLSEDCTAKAWATATMVERTVYAAEPETVLALAVRPDQKQLALGRYDGHVLLRDEATGALQAEPLPVKPRPPELTRITPTSGQRGRPVRVRFEGEHLDGAAVTANYPGMKVKLLPDGKQATAVTAELTFPPITPAGVYRLRIKTPAGQSAEQEFTVDPFPAVQEAEPNDSPNQAQKVTLPVSVVGAVQRPGDVDFFRFEATAGQQIGVQVLTSAVGSSLNPVLELTDATGRVLAEADGGVLGYVCPKAGSYTVGIHDREYRGGNLPYRLHVGDLPVITAVFPLGIRQGTEADFEVQGVNLTAGGDPMPNGGLVRVHVKAPASAAPGSRLPVPVTSTKGTPLGAATVVVGEFPEIVADGAAKGLLGTPPLVPAPGTADGRILPGRTDTWRFRAKKGQRLVVEVNAQRSGSPLDSFIEIQDAAGRPVPLATLRCVAKTYATFQDHNSVSPGIRLETWSELAVNDYLLIGTELIRIKELPRNPDDDCQFFSVGGRRLAYLGTTPTYHSLGTPMYKVAIHPPGTKFPPNGMPVVTLYHRNDDGGPGYGKDSRLFFDPPADGEYHVRVGDARGQGGSNYVYQLTVRPPRPGFSVRFNPLNPTVSKGQAVPVLVDVDRTDGFDGRIDVRLVNLPPGFRAPATSVPPEEYTTAFALYASAAAADPAKPAPLKLMARARIDGKDVVREATHPLPKVVDPGVLVTQTEQSEVTLPPGGRAAMTTRIERRKGFKGRVPLEVRGLPHGVHVLDIGLNGILITEQDTSRTFVIYAEPWVRPTSHPFVVSARHEATGKEYAAPPVVVKVVK
jgi:WD40 repeat protein